MWTSETIEILSGNPIPKMYKEVSDPNSQETLGQLSKVSPSCKEKFVFDSHCGVSGWNILFHLHTHFPFYLISLWLVIGSPLSLVLWQVS